MTAMIEFFQGIYNTIAGIFSLIGDVVSVIFSVFSIIGNFFSGLLGTIGFSPLTVYLAAAFGLLIVAAIVILVIRLM